MENDCAALKSYCDQLVELLSLVRDKETLEEERVWLRNFIREELVENEQCILQMEME
jgi:hypothetical protein